MAREYDLTPRRAPPCGDAVSPDRYRVSGTRISSHPREAAGVRAARHARPAAVVWHRAEGFQVYDAWGNQWIDWSSGVLIANAGHGRPEIADAIQRQAAAHLLTNYCFPSEIRARLVER